MINLFNKIIYTKYRLAILLICFFVITVSLSLVLAQSLPRFFVIEYTVFKDGKATFNSIKLLQGDELIYPASKEGYSFQLRDLENNIIAQKTLNLEFKAEVDTDKGYLPIDIDRIDGFIRIPYHQDAETLELTNPAGKILTKAKLKDYICQSDNLCPAICRNTADPDCQGQGRCGDGICQTRYENENICPFDCAIENQIPQEINQTQEKSSKEDLNNYSSNGFIIFLIVLTIIALGVYAYLVYKKHHKT